MLDLLIKHHFGGIIGIKYKGNTLYEEEGIRATKNMLIKIRNELK